MYLVINKCVTAVKVSNFSGHYLRNRSTLDIGVLGYIGIVQHKEHSPEVFSIPPGTLCIDRRIMRQKGGWIVCSGDCEVGSVSRIRDGRSAFEFRQGREIFFLFFGNVYPASEAHPTFNSAGTGVLFRR